MLSDLANAVPEFVIAPSAKRGDLVRIIAPAGPFDRTLLWRGLGWLSRHFRLAYDRSMFERCGYHAGSDERRLRELVTALHCPDTRVIVAARGGYGSSKLVGHADFETMVQHPKWLVGFSDITALHSELQRRGVASLHAHNVTGLGRGDSVAREHWLDALLTPSRPRAFGELQVLHPGRATGALCGGNLTVLHHAAVAGRWPCRGPSVLFVEDVSEAPYSIDRMLNSLHQGGFFENVAALVVGELVDCRPGRYGVTALDVFRSFAQRLDKPVLWGLPVGHGRQNLPLHFGFPATVDARQTRGSLSIHP